MYCTCGKENPVGARFCSSCGRAISSTAEITPTPIPTNSIAAPAAQQAAINQPGPLPEATRVAWPDYWYGYMYSAFCVFLTYTAMTHLGASVAKGLPKGDPAEQAYFWVYLLLQVAAVVFFALAAYKLVRQRASLSLVYTIAGLHGLNVVLNLWLKNVAIWLAVSGTAIHFFRRARSKTPHEP